MSRLSDKLCFSTLCCPEWSLDQIISAAVKNGMHGVDFRGIQQTLNIAEHEAFTTQLDETLEKFRSANLQMPCFNSSIKLVEPDPAVWEKWRTEFAQYADLCIKTQTKWIRVFGGAVPPGMTRADALVLARRHLHELEEIAAGWCGVAVETHDAWSTSKDMLELLAESPAAGALWDIEHTFRHGESPAATLAQLGKRIVHVHLKDSIRRDGKNIPMLLGEGELPVRDALRALVDSGYPGWICLEVEKRWHAAAPEPDATVSQFAQFIGNHIAGQR